MLGGEKRRVDNGVNIGGPNTSVLVTLLWAACSIIVVFYGIWHCRSSSFSDSFICNESECKLHIGDNRDQNYVFPRSDLTHVEVVRVNDDNKVTNWYQLEPREVNKLGHNIELKFLYSSESENSAAFQSQRQVLLSHRDMGRVRARTAYAQIRDYTESKSDFLSVHYASHLSTFGVLAVALGAVSVLFSCLLGQWSDPVPKRMKKKA